jgi:GT2 family glycosyltransferase
VPIYKALDDVKLCLDSLKNNFDFNQGEVFLINDCSNKDTFDFLEQFSILNPQFKLIHNQENLGFVKTCNKGMELSQGEIIVLLNSDTRVPSSFCEKIIECFDKNPNVRIASPIGSYTGSYFIPLLENMTLEEMNKRLKKSYLLFPEYQESLCRLQIFSLLLRRLFLAYL